MKRVKDERPWAKDKIDVERLSTKNATGKKSDERPWAKNKIDVERLLRKMRKGKKVIGFTRTFEQEL